MPDRAGSKTPGEGTAIMGHPTCICNRARLVDGLCISRGTTKWKIAKGFSRITSAFEEAGGISFWRESDTWRLYCPFEAACRFPVL